jgi:hypothetical protein
VRTRRSVAIAFLGMTSWTWLPGCVEPTDVPVDGGTDPGHDAPADRTDGGVADDGADSPPPDAGGCPIVRWLHLPDDSASGTLDPGVGPIVEGCLPAIGAEALFGLEVAATAGVQLTADTAFSAVLSVRSACNDSAPPAACAEMGPYGGTTIHTVLEPGVYFVVLDEYSESSFGGRGGSYRLALSTFEPAANGVCSGAAVLTAAEPLAGDTAGGGAPTGACSAGLRGPVSFYAFDVPAMQRATVTVTPAAGATWRPAVGILASCAATACEWLTEAGADGAGVAGNADNPGASPRSVVAVVGARAVLPTGPFTVSLRYDPLRTEAANASCASATRLEDGMELRAEDGSFATELAPVCGWDTSSPVLYYAATIPVGATLTVDMVPGGGAGTDPLLRLLASCAATDCVTSYRYTLSYTNPGTTPLDVIVAAGSKNSMFGLFDLTVTIR